MPYTWLQLQWLKNNSTLDFTSKYEVFRSSSPGVDETSLKIMDVQHPNNANVYIVVSDTPDNKSADDIFKTYIGPPPYDFMGPAKIDNLVNTPSAANNKATISWAIPNDVSSTWYYRTRAIDTDNHPSDLSLEFSAALLSELHTTPYHLQRSQNGIIWEDVGYQAGTTYEELNVDVAGPNAVTSATATPSLPAPGVGKIRLRWYNSDIDNGTNTYYYRVRARDNTSVLFPGHPDNWSQQNETDRGDYFSDAVAPQTIAVGITHGTGGVEIRYRNAKQTAVTQSITLTSDSMSVGFTRVVVGSVVVRPNGGGIPFTESVDYEMDYPGGIITRLGSGNIPVGATIAVDYQYNDGVRAIDSDSILASYDGTYFTNGYAGLETYDHTGLLDRDCYNYRIRVKDNVGNWSGAFDLIVNIDDSTPPPVPQDFVVTAFSS